jgi:hypothetical protein
VSTEEAVIRLGFAIVAMGALNAWFLYRILMALERLGKSARELALTRHPPTVGSEE